MVVGLIVYYFGVLHPFNSPKIQIDGVYLATPKNIPDLSLRDQHGKPFTTAQLKGHWTLLFFGFTHCPMVCPTIFDVLNNTYLILEKQLPANLLPMIVFVTIDPERDTIARLNEYVTSYNPHFVGVRTDADSTKILAKQFSISVTGANENIVHNTDVLLINPQAKIQAYFLFPQRPQSMAKDYLKIVRTK